MCTLQPVLRSAAPPATLLRYKRLLKQTRSPNRISLGQPPGVSFTPQGNVQILEYTQRPGKTLGRISPGEPPPPKSPGEMQILREAPGTPGDFPGEPQGYEPIPLYTRTVEIQENVEEK